MISSDWLAWRHALKQGHKSLHFEHDLNVWPSEEGDPNELFIRAARWPYVDSDDPTIFHGVSLAKQFTGFLIHVIRGYIRLRYALNRIFTVYRPTEVEFIDLWVDVGALTAPTRRSIVKEIAIQHGIRFLDRSDPIDDNDPELPEIPYQLTPKSESTLRRIARSLYAIAVDLAFSLRRPKASGVFLLLNPMTTANLVNSYLPSRVCPVLIADQMPKTSSFLKRCWLKGIILVRRAQQKLSLSDRRELANKRIEIENRWRHRPATSVEEICRNAFLEFWDGGEVLRRAEMIVSYEKFIDRGLVERIVIGDIGNYTCHMLAELGAIRGIPVDECLNGMFVTPIRHDGRCGDGIRPSVVGRILTWGRSSEQWVKKATASLEAVRVGYPGIKKKDISVSNRQFQRGLVLPIALDVGDVTASRSNIMYHLIDVVGALQDSGISNIRIKTHPGRVNPRYYQDALLEAGLDYPVRSDGALAEHLEWSDFVVGPANSGAWVETLAFGRPYYPLRPEPSLIDPAFCGDAELYTCGAEIARDIANGIVPDGPRILNELCSVDDIPDAAGHFWRVIGS